MSLPWWASLYLGIYAFVAIGSALEVYPRNRLWAFLGLLSFCFVILFVVGYFSPYVAARLGWMVIPMTLSGFAWEVYFALQDVRRADQELDSEVALTDEEKSVIKTVAMALNCIIVVPGYMVGGWLGYLVITGAGGIANA